jgi:branched-chain amino acid transport system permease protein
MNKRQIIVVILISIGLIFMPFLIKKDSILNLLCMILLYITLASSWNILGGYTGQTNLGHAAFFGLGALTTRMLWFSGLPILFSLPLGGIVAVLLALLIGYPAFKLKGAYFSIGTLALAQILFATVGNIFPTISSLPIADLATYQLTTRYLLFLAVALFTIIATYFLTNSSLGLGMMAVREEEDAAESLGVDALKHKLLALLVSSFFAGLAGGAFAFYHVGYYPQFPFSPVWTFDSVMMAYIGGTGNVIGPIIGAIFFVTVQEFLSLKLVELHLTVFGILFILVVLFLPGGFIGLWKKIRKSALDRQNRNIKVKSENR